MKSIIFVSFVLASLFTSTIAHGAGGELFMSPGSSVQTVEEPFEVHVLANTNGQSVNAIEGELVYNPNDFSVQKISIEQSQLTTWATPPSYDGATGLIKFSGWAERSFTGSNGLIMKITLLPLHVGQSGLVFNSGAMLEAQAQGSNIITSMRSSSFKIQPKKIQAPVSTLQTESTQAATSVDATPTSTPTAPPLIAPQSIAAPPVTVQAAGLAFSGIEFTPLLLPFLVILTLIAFCIAYILHKMLR